MNAVIAYTHTPRQIALIKSTVAKDCNHDEFDLFSEVARAKGLDPFLGQIIPMIFNKDDPKKRKMTIIISRDGQRVIAQRCGDYRPASKPPTYEIDAILKSEINPHGIVSATVYLWKQDAKTAAWYEVAGQAFWDEFAPIKTGADEYEWVDTGEVWEDTGKPKKKKKPIGATRQMLDDSGNWVKMPRLMIAKVAEMQALRAGWPEQFGGVYAEEELDRAKVIDLTASEIVEAEAAEQRMLRIGGEKAVTFIFDNETGLERIPVGQVADRFLFEARKAADLNQFATLRARNSDSLKEFWAMQPSDALELKKALEAMEERLRQAEPSAQSAA